MATRGATTGTAKRPKRNGDPHRQGRPHDLDKPIPQPQGAPIPASEAILRQMRTGLPLAESALSVGIDRSVAFRWRGDGAAVHAALHEDRLTVAQLTDYQHAVATFYDGAMRAEAEAQALYSTRLSTLARGGYVTEREVIEYDKDDNVLARRVTRTALPPDTKAVTFALERRWPQAWGRSQRIELAAGVDGPLVQTESPLGKLTAALEAIERRKAAGAVLAVVDVQETQPEEQTA